MSRLNFALLLLTLLPGLHQSAAAQSQIKPENRRTATVSGRIILNGEPLGGVTIQIFPERMLASGDPRVPLKTVADEQGRYRITGIIAGSYHISIVPNEFLISGVAGPRSRGVRSNRAGEFQFQGILPGNYVLYPETGAEREYFTEPVTCEITDSGVDGIEVRLLPGSSISGTFVIEGSNDPALLAKLSQVRIGGFSKSRQPINFPREPAKINADGSFRIVGLRPGRVSFSLVSDPKSAGFSIKRIERNGALIEDGLEIGPGENLSNVRGVVGHGNLTLRGEVKMVGGSLPRHVGIYVNLNRVNESESGSTLGAFVDARGQFIFQNLIPGDYEVRLIAIILQPGEPRDPSLSKLIHSTKQKVSISRNSQPTGTLVVDLSQKGNK